MEINKKGISLIVLILTIIVMIILATAIILSISNSGIMDKASKAKKYTDISNAEELVATKKAEWELMTETEKNLYNNSFANYAAEEMKKAGYKMGYNVGEYEVTETGKVYVYPVIPEGFTLSKIEGETKVSEGMVIYEIPEGESVDWTLCSSGDATVLDVQEKYNQFVWIPVNNINKFIIKEGYSKLVLQDKVSSGKVMEPVNKTFNSGVTLSAQNDLTGEHAEYKAMKSSVEKYGGFYIARYEAGDADTREMRTGVTEAHKVVVKRNVYPYNYIAWGESQTSVELYTKNEVENVAGAVWLARSIYPKEENYSVVSHLPYGVQWDAAMSFLDDVVNVLDSNNKYIQDSRGMGWYWNETNMEYVKTGTDLNWDKDSDGVFELLATNKVKNIYDMAGNVAEFTMEYSTSRTCRGGYSMNSGYNQPASSRTIGLGIYERNGFRPVLYIKEK